MAIKAVLSVYQMEGVCNGFNKAYMGALGIHLALKKCKHPAVRKGFNSN